MYWPSSHRLEGDRKIRQIGKTYYLESYGCSASFADSEMIAGMLSAEMIKPVVEVEEADVIIIITCTVKTSTSHRMIHRIRKLSEAEKPIVVAGCMPKTERNIIESINPNASLLGPASLEKIIETVDKTIRGIRCVNIQNLPKPKLLLPRIRRNPIIGIIEISSGCRGNCNFCQVKIAKGELISYDNEKIVTEVKQAITDGCREIWLTSQDNGCYGKDIGTNLPELLRRILRIENDFRIRLGMMNPHYAEEMKNEFADLFKDERIFKFLHLPVQSGSGTILQKMNRPNMSTNYIFLTNFLREKIPSLTLSTDIIVGFPSESDEEFQQTVELIRRSRPDIVHISKFKSRPGTKAEKMKELDPRTINERSKLIHKVVKEIAFENNKRWVGWSGKVMVDEEVKGAVMARNFAYKPIIIKGKIPLGNTLSVEVIRSTSDCLYGEIRQTH